MKKLKFVLFIAAIFITLNCSSDDERKRADCFDCIITGVGTRFCKFGNDNTYTVTIIGGPEEEYSLGEQTWEEFKDEMLQSCE